MKPIHYLVAFVALNHIGMAGMRMVAPLYALHLGAPPAVVGMLVGLFAVVPTFASVMIGRLVDRVGTTRPLVVFALILIAGVLLPFVFYGSTVPLYAAGLVVGGGYYAQYIVSTALGGYYGGPGERAGNFVLASLGISGANAVAPLIAGFAIDQAGFRSTFLLLAIAPALSLGLFLLGKLPQRGAVAANSARGRGPLMDLWRNPQLRATLVISVYFMLLWDIFLVITPIYGSELKFSASIIGIILGTFSAAGFVVRIFIPLLARRFTPMQLLLGSQAVGGAALFAFGLGDTALVLVVTAFVLGMGQGLGGPMITTALYEASPPDRVGEAVGLKVSVMMASQAILPLIAGVAAEAVGVAPLFWFTGAVVLGGVWQYHALWHVRPLARNAPGQDLAKEKS